MARAFAAPVELLRSDSEHLRYVPGSIAKAMVDGPVAGLARLDEVGADPRIVGHYRLDAVRAHLLERAGDRDSAIACYRRAAERTASIAERNYLLMQAAQLRDASR